MSKLSLIVLVVAAMAVIDSANGLQCHQCSSFTDAQCADPFVIEPQREGQVRRPKNFSFLKDCPNDGKNYTLCRKIYQYVRGDTRIIRSCGYEEYTKRDCYKTVLEEYNTYVCQCKEDGCNSAVNVQVPAFALAAALLVSQLLK